VARPVIAREFAAPRRGLLANLWPIVSRAAFASSAVVDERANRHQDQVGRLRCFQGGLRCAGRRVENDELGPLPACCIEDGAESRYLRRYDGRSLRLPSIGSSCCRWLRIEVNEGYAPSAPSSFDSQILSRCCLT
jgi:hypothetical protein